jgi:hypothetical protein
MLYRFISTALVLFPLSGCSPAFLSTMDDIATQDAISLTIDREAFQKDTDVKISIEVINKEPSVIVPVQPVK